jgi:hypothetical protein
MSWEPGVQKRSVDRDINAYLEKEKGFLKERDARLLLYEFLRQNTTFTTDLICGIKLFPFQHMAVKAMFETDYFLGVWSRGMSKSFTTGIYALLDAILNQGVEIGILSKSFRQAKMIFKKIEDISRKPEAALLQQCITKVSKHNDQWTMEIGNSRIHALPLGDGEKLRGFRFQRIIIDEFLLMPERIYNEVIIPFLSVVENPTQRDDLYKAETEFIKKGSMKESERYSWPNNKLIMLSSASYKFEYMYKVYEKFEALITGQEKEKSDAHRVIMHFSYDCAPTQLYDQNLMDQAKSTMSQSQFDREFGAVFTDDSSGYFKTSRMAECTVVDGDNPCVEVCGESSDKYVLAFDPSWAETESSDDFAIQVFKLNDKAKHGTLVHSYALSGSRLKDHINYFCYLITHFNISCIVGDYNGGVQFMNALIESSVFKHSKKKIEIIDGMDFNRSEIYHEDLKSFKDKFHGDFIPCYLKSPTSSWIRNANELLQANLDHKKIWFAARAVSDNYQKQRNKKIPISKLKFLPASIASAKESNAAKMIDFVEHQGDMISLTKVECSLIQITTSAQGTQSFDLPLNLRRQSGRDKARKDSYSALLLGNWMIKIYYDMQELKNKPVENTFAPMFIS